jgi:hypothetical protein
MRRRMLIALSLGTGLGSAPKPSVLILPGY